MNDETDLRGVLAKALENATSEDLRRVAAEVIRDKLTEWDMRDIIAQAITPIVKAMLAEKLKDPAMLDIIKERVERAAVSAVQNFTVEFKKGW